MARVVICGFIPRSIYICILRFPSNCPEKIAGARLSSGRLFLHSRNMLLLDTFQHIINIYVCTTLINREKPGGEKEGKYREIDSKLNRGLVHARQLSGYIVNNDKSRLQFALYYSPVLFSPKIPFSVSPFASSPPPSDPPPLLHPNYSAPSGRPISTIIG